MHLRELEFIKCNFNSPLIFYLFEDNSTVAPHYPQRFHFQYPHGYGKPWVLKTMVFIHPPPLYQTGSSGSKASIKCVSCLHGGIFPAPAQKLVKEGVAPLWGELFYIEERDEHPE